jgi:chromosome partitioning protein
MAQTISFSIFKGGTGKTTSSVNTASALAEKGKRVLLVDMDQQASATKYLAIDPDTTGVHTYNSFMNNAPLRLAIQHTGFGFDLIPSHELLSAIEAMMESGKDEGMLREKLDNLQDEYDFILIDTPPGKAMLTFNAIVASNHILVPVSAERMAIEGLADLIKHLHSVLWRRFTDLDQDLLILFTMYKANTSHSPGIVAEAKKIYRDNILPFYIPESIEFPRSFEHSQPMTTYMPTHPGAAAYRQLAEWLINEKRR